MPETKQKPVYVANTEYVDEMNEKSRQKNDQEEEMKRKYLAYLNRLNGIGVKA